MKVFLCYTCFIVSSAFCEAQQIVNAVMVGDKGITKNVKQAKYLVVVKKYNDTSFERLDYSFTGPIVRRASYKDSLLNVLNGSYAGFAGNGYLSEEGKYQNNKKEGSWYLCDDTAHATVELKYHSDSLIATISLDSLAKERKKIKEDTTGEIEAFYKGGDLIKFITKNLKVPDRTANVSKGGTVRVRFVIDTLGNPVEVKIVKSVEFAFDEEAMRVVSLAKDWSPASRKGKKLRAFREQPISVKFE